jgi:putative radical SAM enzyme (TIGR03279 family)
MATATPITAPISSVRQDSPAYAAGVRAGWELVSVNGQEMTDILAYRRELETGTARIVARDPLLKDEVTLTLEWDDPGLEFEEVIFDGIKKCANKCEFCYVHQMPRGFRKSLYMMDDDFRTSFLYGSFVTLTNLSETDIQRILNENLSPLYVSVHTMNQTLRQDMMKWWRLKVKDEGATKIRDMLKRLEPIDLFTQMVLLPERNDGEYLTETLEALAAYPNIQAVACVPVGLTEHRKNLPDLKPYTPEQAKDVLKRIHDFQEKMLAERGTRFAFASDEFYILAGEPLPQDDDYEGYQMLENGVGMVRDFLSSPLPKLPKRLAQPRKVLLATGKLFAPILEEAIKPLRKIEGLRLEVRTLTNRTFGEVTTVAGLLAGRDFLTQITPGEADLLLVSPNVLKFGTEKLLDERTMDDLREGLKMQVEVGGTNLAELFDTIISGVGEKHLPQFGFSTHAIKETAKQH